MPEDFDQAGLQAAFESAKGSPVLETPTEPIVAEPAPAEPTTAAEPVAAAPIEPAFNPSEYFKTATEGFIDSEEKFKEFIPKIKNYDDLETKLKAAEANKVEFKNSETEALYKAWANGDKDAVVNYIKETTKDYTTMSDVDVVREALAKKNPSWTSKDVELELRAEYGKQLEMIDLSGIEQTDDDGKTTEEYKEAVRHNERVEENTLRLQRSSRDARIALIEQQKNIELPQLTKNEPAPVSNQPPQEELAQRQAAWEKNVDENLPKLYDLKMNINDKEVEYVRTEDEKKELAIYMKTFNIFNFAKEQGWTKEDGTPDPLRIAEDVHFLKNKDKIFKSTGTQIDTMATKDALKKIKNIPDDLPAAGETDAQPGSLAEAYNSARSEAGWQR